MVAAVVGGARRRIVFSGLCVGILPRLSFGAYALAVGLVRFVTSGLVGSEGRW